MAANELWVRNDKGKVWGPLQPSTLEVLFDQGLIEGQVQLSTDGVNYVYPGRLPGARNAVPRELWGDVVLAEEAPAPRPPVMVPGPPPGAGPHAPPGGPVGAPMAGPGAMASAARGAPPRLNPQGPPPVVTATPVAPAPAPAPAPPQAAVPKPAAAPPPPGSLSDLPTSGELSTLSVVRLYGLAGGLESTGLLTITLNDRTLAIHFRKGNPDHLESSHPDDGLPAFLMKHGLATIEQLTKTEAEKAKFGGELLPALFGSGVLNPGTAFQHLVARSAGLLQQAVLAANGSFTWEPKELPAQRAFPLGNRWTLLTEAMRKLPVPELRRRLGDAVDRPVMKSGGRVAVTDLRLTPQETRALAVFDGVRTLNMLARDLPSETDAMVRVAWYLRELEAVSFGVNLLPMKDPPPPAAVAAPPPAAPKPAAPAPPPQVAAARPIPVVGPGAKPQAQAAPAAARPPPPAAPARPPPQLQQSAAPAAPAAAAPPLDAAAEIAVLKKTLEKLATQNHFEVLGVPEAVNAAQVKVAYFKLARSYHPDTVPPGAPEELGKLKAQVFARVGEAHRVLSDDGLRAAYVEELKSGGAADVDVVRILQAEETFQKATIQVKARKFADAVKTLDEAITANPDEGEYYAWRGYAKFFAATDKKAAHATAMADINACLKRNDKVAQAWYFQGHMAKVLGDLSGAKKHFQRCIALKADHLEAQRELRLMK